MHLNKNYTKPTCLGYIICKIKDYFGSWKCIPLRKVSVNMFFWKFIGVGNLGRLVFAYCLLKDDMPFVSGSYMIEYIEKSGLFFFQKAKKMGPTISTRK